MAPKRTVAKPATEPPAAKVAKVASQKTEKAAPKEKAPKKEAAPKEKAPKKEAAPKEKAVKEKAPKEKAVKEEKTPKEKAVKEEKAPKEKAAKPAAKAKAAAKGATSVDVTEFGEVLLETCKVLMTVCQTSQFEDEDAQTVTTTENFAVHGAGVLALLPEDARLPMMKIALHYREELDKEFDMYDGMDDDDEEEDDDVEGEEEAKEGEAAAVASGIVVKDAEAEEEEGEEDDEDDEADFDVMVPQQFFWLKECFTEAEAAELVKSAKEGGALCKAIEAALESVETAEEEEEEGEEDDEEEEGEEEDEAEEDEEEDEWGENAPWKTA